MSVTTERLPDVAQDANLKNAYSTAANPAFTFSWVAASSQRAVAATQVEPGGQDAVQP